MTRRGWILAAALIGAFAIAGTTPASGMLRVGNQVLSVGDSAGRVTDLLGKPASRSHARGSGRSSGKRRRTATANAGGQVECWNYRRDGRYITVTLTDGLVSDIDERAR